MREHTRDNGRYFRTEVGALTLDWGSNGADYTTLDFSYVAKGKGGNLTKIYGQVRRNEDNETYDTYDIKAGRNRQITTKNGTIGAAIRAHVSKVIGLNVYDIDVKGKMPIVPNTIREELSAVIMTAIKKWDFFWRGAAKKWDDETKQQARETFVLSMWDSGKFFSDEANPKKGVVAVGLLNIDTADYSNLYRLWRETLEEVAKD